MISENVSFQIFSPLNTTYKTLLMKKFLYILVILKAMGGEMGL